MRAQLRAAAQRCLKDAQAVPLAYEFQLLAEGSDPAAPAAQGAFGAWGWGRPTQRAVLLGARALLRQAA
eukprot:15474497-Alexandrium_andersonii.AAC.1